MTCNWKKDCGTVMAFVTFTVPPVPLMDPPSDDQFPSVKLVLDCNWYIWPDTDGKATTY